MFKRKWLLLPAVLMLVVITVITMVLPAFAATTAVVTVTNTVQYLAVSVAGTTYNFNGISARGVLPSTTYYSNPLGQTTAPSATVVDGECSWTLTNGSSVAADFVCDSSDMSGGTDNSTNGETGTAGATSYGAYSYYSGMTFTSKVLMKKSGSTNYAANLAAAGTLKAGIQLNEQTNAWTGGTAPTFTVKYTVAAH